MDVREHRVKFVVAAERGDKPFNQLCQEFGISRPTGYLWFRRYQLHGLEGIQELSRRPQHIPRHTSGELERLVVQFRLRYPDWGARKLQVVLSREGVSLTHSTIHRTLLRFDMLRHDKIRAQANTRISRARVAGPAPSAPSPLSMTTVDTSPFCRHSAAPQAALCENAWNKRSANVACPKPC